MSDLIVNIYHYEWNFNLAVEKVLLKNGKTRSPQKPQTPNLKTHIWIGHLSKFWNLNRLIDIFQVASTYKYSGTNQIYLNNGVRLFEECRIWIAALNLHVIFCLNYLSILSNKIRKWKRNIELILETKNKYKSDRRCGKWNHGVTSKQRKLKKWKRR